MKEDGASFLEIFQDPLLTIVALILLNTTWVVIPERIEPVEHKPSVKRDVISIEDKINKLKIEIQGKQEELKWLKKKIEELNAMLQSGGEDIGQINQKIQELQEELEKKKEELKQLEDALKKAKEELAGLPGVENIEELYAKVSKLERETEERRSDLRQLEKQIEIAKQRAVESEVQADTQKKIIDQMIIKRDALLAGIARLETELAKKKTGGGFHSIKQTNKRAYIIELENNRLFPGFWHGSDANDIKENYNINKYSSYAELKRKPTVKGESIEEIKKTTGGFHKILNNKINHNKEYIVFLVCDDSYEIFRKAREIAEEKGVQVGWRPFNGVHFAGGGGGVGKPPQPRE